MRGLLTKGLPTVALALAATWIVVSTTAGADADGTSTGAVPEPITGTPVEPNPGSETGPLRPFDPPSEGSIGIEHMTAEEQAVIEYGFDHPNSSSVHAGFAAATAQAAERAAAEAAANAAGLEAIGAGVVP